MFVTEEDARLDGDGKKFFGAGHASRGEAMEARTHCAYNQTRECFLGLDVAPADLSPTALAEKMKSLLLRSGQGLWVAPFRGLLICEVPAPFDLIYLDDDGRVLDTVESFPTFRANPSKTRPTSLLALPAHSIYSSQTQVGDQLVVCVAEEMEQRLDGLAAGRSGLSVQSAVLLREQPLWSGGPGVLELESASGKLSATGQPHEMGLAKPENRPYRAPKNWIERWWSPDPRKAPRIPAPGLAAYFWNGTALEAHGIRDISSTGVYVVTEERWYPGTLVLMMLQRTDVGEQVKEHSIAVKTRAVRWGRDGVGLQFVLDDNLDGNCLPKDISEAADRKEFKKFLQQLKMGQ
jgi:uncharacterized membrane protein (UPF0127 family)